MGIIKDIDKKAKSERKKGIKALGSGRISEGIDHANKVATLEHMSNVLKTHFGPNFSERRPRSSKSRYVNFTESEKKSLFHHLSCVQNIEQTRRLCGTHKIPIFPRYVHAGIARNASRSRGILCHSSADLRCD